MDLHLFPISCWPLQHFSVFAVVVAACTCSVRLIKNSSLCPIWTPVLRDDPWYLQASAHQLTALLLLPVQGMEVPFVCSGTGRSQLKPLFLQFNILKLLNIRKNMLNIQKIYQKKTLAEAKKHKI